MLSNTPKTQHLRRYCVNVLNREVFAKVRFLTKEQRDIVYDSYVQNIDAMIEYVAVHNLNFEQYFKEIRGILLKSHYVREYTR